MTFSCLFQVHAHLCGGEFYRGGEVCAHDFDYNLAIIRFSSITPSGSAKVAKVVRIDDSVDVYSHQTSQPPFYLLPHSRSHKLTPGDRVTVMGRYFAEPFEPMAAPGEYWLDYSIDFDMSIINPSLLIFIIVSIRLS